jgi:hypothetical protein
MCYERRRTEACVDRSIVLLLFLQKQNLENAIYLFGLGTLLTGLGLKHMRILSHPRWCTGDTPTPRKTMVEYYVSYLSTPPSVHYYK